MIKNSRDKYESSTNNLFDQIKNNLESVWRALGDRLQEEISQLTSSEEFMYSGNESRQLEAIELINFCLEELQIEEKMIDQNGTFYQLLKPILSRLLSGVEQLSNINFEDALPAL